MHSPANTIVLSLKDAFREMRYSVRREAGLIDKTLDTLGGDLRAKATSFLPLSETPVLRLTDAVFGRLEKAATLAFAPELSTTAYPYLKPVSAFVMPLEGRRKLADADFVQAQYRFARDVLHELGVENLLLSEQAVETARQMLQARHAELLACISDRPAEALPPTERSARIRFCAAIAHALNAARPIRRLDLPMGKEPSRHLLLSPNLYCFTLTALATAIVSITPLGPDTGLADVVEAANTVVDVRFARFSAAMGSRDPVGALTREFKAVLPYLP